MQDQDVKTVMEIALTLRGLSYDGIKGNIVVFCGDQQQAEREASRETLVPQWKPGTRSIKVEGVGTFRLGADYDDAINGTNTVSPAIGRNAVVHGKVCVVTGGAQGFGEAIVRGLVANGALVMIADRNAEGATALAQELNQHYQRTVAFGIDVDVTNETSVRSMVERVVILSGGIDVFISNAGVLKAGSVKHLDLHDFKFVTDVNYTGFFLCTQHAARVMEKMNRATHGGYPTDIINIGSKSALEGSNKNGAYAGSKFGSIGLVQSFAKELVEDNIKVNAICPGNYFDGPLWSDPEKGLFVQYLNAGKVPGAQTVEDVREFYERQVPMRRGCTGQDVLKAILYTIEQHYETGQAIPVTGGQVMLN